MGATDFDVTVSGETIQQAFASATAAARHEHGHGGYTGTIAEKSAFSVVSPPEGVTTDQLARWAMEPNTAPEAHKALANKLASIVDDKWGPALGLATSQPHQFRFLGLASC